MLLKPDPSLARQASFFSSHATRPAKLRLGESLSCFPLI